jgi:uncharacterized protein (TIRG00374 family)
MVVVKESSPSARIGSRIYHGSESQSSGETPVRSPARKLLVQVLVYATAAACLILVFHGINFQEHRQNLGRVSWSYCLLAAVFNASIYFSNSWRWKELLRPVTHVHFRKSLQAVYIALFLNETLPLRPGEIVRCGLLARWVRGLRFSVALSSIVIERLTEFAWLEIALVVVVLLTPVPQMLTYACEVLSGILLGLVLMAIVLARRSQGVSVGSTNKFAQKWHRFVNGFRLMGKAGTMTTVVGLSLVGLGLNVLATWALIRACGIALPLLAAAAVLIIIRVGMMIPTTPGSVGAYQFFAVLSLRLFGVSKTVAATFTVIAFATFTLPLLAGGAAAIVFAGANFSEMFSLSSHNANAK